MRRQIMTIGFRAALILLGVALGATIPFGYAQERTAKAKTLEERVDALEKRLAQLERAAPRGKAQTGFPSSDVQKYDDAAEAFRAYLNRPSPNEGTPFEFNGRTYYRVPLSAPAAGVTGK